MVTRKRSARNALSTGLRSATGNPVQSPYQPGMVRNPAGGYVFAMTDADQFMQFLRLGTHTSYYTSVDAMTIDRLAFAFGYMDNEPLNALASVALADLNGSLMPNAILMALAYLNTTKEPAVNNAAANMVHMRVRTGYHAMMYLKFLNEVIAFRRSRGESVGWGRSKTRGLRRWVEGLSDRELVLQRIKYNSREGYSIQDVINMSHPRPAKRHSLDEGDVTKRRAILSWIMGSEIEHVGDVFQRLLTVGDEDVKQIEAWGNLLSKEISPERAAELVRTHRIPREGVPTHLLRHNEVWSALLPMPVHATIRNLANLEKRGLVDNDETWAVIQDTLSVDRMVKSRVLPAHLIKASAMTKSDRVKKLLDERFYELLDRAEVMSDARAVIAVDVSGSMNASAFGMPVSCRVLSQAVASAYHKTFTQSEIIGFDDSLHEPINTRAGLDYPHMFSNVGGNTDASLVTGYIERTRDADNAPDVVIFLTDQNTWQGSHVQQAVDRLRVRFNKPILLVTNAFEAHGMTLAAGGHPLSFDTHGFDASSIEAVHTRLALIRERVNE